MSQNFKFQVNNDLDNIRFNFHNKIHFFGSMVLAVFFGFVNSYSIWVLWEFGDGWKPNWHEYKDKDYGIFSKLVNLFRKECLFADKFSLQDLLVHDLCGAAIGHVIRIILMGVF